MAKVLEWLLMSLGTLPSPVEMHLSIDMTLEDLSRIGATDVSAVEVTLLFDREVVSWLLSLLGLMVENVVSNESEPDKQN